MPVYSHSQLSTFEQCPLKFKFRYIDKIRKPEEKGIEAFAGSLVHETLQKLYDDLKYEKRNSLEDLVAYYRDGWQKGWNSGIKIVREGLREENYHDYGEKCIRNYYHRYQPFDQSLTIATEMHLAFPLDAQGRYPFQGYIDRLARRPDGAYEIHDYKTGGRLPDQELMDRDRQLPLYQCGLQTRWRDAERVDLIWHYVALDVTLVSHRAPEEIKDLTQKTIRLIDRIEATTDFPPVKSQLCDWCEYRPECPLWKHVMAINAMPPEKIAADEGWKLVNEYAEARGQAERLSERINALREGILGFARQQQARVLMGKEIRVSITEREQCALPAEGEPERADLEAFVRSIGKWDDLSVLSASRLAEALGKKEWPRAWRERLQKLLRRRPVATIRLTRKGGRAASEEYTDEA